jgi:hypothetical protein
MRDGLTRLYLTLALVLLAAAAPALAQAPVAGRIPDPPASLKPGPTPRLPDGRPDLGNGKGAWNPRVVANLSGTGRSTRDRSPVESIVDVPFQPWAKTLYDERLANLSIDDPEAKCLPPGIPRLYATPFPFQIYQVPDRIIFIFEGGAHIWRVVYMDGRPHRKEPNPSFVGDAIGRWEGDTLVVDTIGFNDTTWLDQEGHPHTESLHTVERFTRRDEMTLHYQVTIDDRMAYTNSWTTSYTIPWVPGAELLEYICQENNKDLPHMVGK